jgi:hypothetical protein
MSGGEKHIIINPNLFAHNLKNSRTRKSKDNYDDDESGGGGHENNTNKPNKPKIKMRNNGGVGGGVGSKTRYSRKSILRQYRQKQEEMNNDSGILTSFSESGGNTKLFIDTPSSGGGGNRNVAEEESEFKESVDFFKNLEKNVAEGKNVHGGRLKPVNHRHTVKKGPEYGCLKSGNLPTYRQWNMGSGGVGALTRKVSLQVPDGGVPMVSVPPSPPIFVQSGLPVFAQKPPEFHMPTIHIPPSAMPPPPPPMTSYEGGGGTSFVPPLYTETEKMAQQRAKEIYENMRAKENQMMGGGIRATAEDSELKMKKQKKTIMRKLTTGISKKNRNHSEEPGKVSILIPNKTIRKRVDNMKHEMHQTPIQEVKKYLLKHGFIKIGSPAPNDVLRKIYEDLLVLGDVYNRNGENIVYNFKLGSGEK